LDVILLELLVFVKRICAVFTLINSLYCGELVILVDKQGSLKSVFSFSGCLCRLDIKDGLGDAVKPHSANKDIKRNKKKAA
jgi:hypothetical protein